MPEYNQGGPEPEDEFFKVGPVESGPLEEKVRPETMGGVVDCVNEVRPVLLGLAREATNYVPAETGIYLLNNDAYRASDAYARHRYGGRGEVILLKRGGVTIEITEIEYVDSPGEVAETKIVRRRDHPTTKDSDLSVWRRGDGSVGASSMYGEGSIVEDGTRTPSDREVRRVEDEIRSFVSTPESAS